MIVKVAGNPATWLGGVDLAGAPTRATGVCRLAPDGFSETRVLHTDAEIWQWIRAVPLRLLLIDAPLSLPRGRTTLSRRQAVHFRECDRELRRMGIPFFPVTLGPMRRLTARGILLFRRLNRIGTPTYEGYPGGAQDIWGIPRKQHGVEHLRRALRGAGCWGSVDHAAITHDELDAVTLALVAQAHLRKRTIVIGDPGEGVMVLPRPGSKPTPSTFAWSPRSRRHVPDPIRPP